MKKTKIQNSKLFIFCLNIILILVSSADILTIEIEKIEEESSVRSGSEVYFNEEYGFEIRGPKGWIKKINPPIPGYTQKETATFTKPGDKSPFPVIAVSVDSISSFIEEGYSRSALDLSKCFISNIRKIAEGKGGAIRVIQEPREIEINGLKGAQCIIDRIGVEGKFFRAVDYKFMNIKKDIFVSVQGMDWPGTFQDHLKDFEEAVKSFKFIERPED